MNDWIDGEANVEMTIMKILMKWSWRSTQNLRFWFVCDLFSFSFYFLCIKKNALD